MIRGGPTTTYRARYPNDCLIRVYFHVNRARVRSADYECHDGFGVGFPIRRAKRFFDEDFGPHNYRPIAFGQEGFAFAFHLEATRP